MEDDLSRNSAAEASLDHPRIIQRTLRLRQHQHGIDAGNGNAKISGMILKGVFLAIAMAMIPVLQKQSPELVMKYAGPQSSIARSWELINLVFVGLAISYGIMARRAAEPEQASDEEYAHKMFALADVFQGLDNNQDEHDETPPLELEKEQQQELRNDNNPQSFSSKWSTPESLNVIEKPLCLPVRSLRHSLSDAESSDFMDAAKAEVRKDSFTGNNGACFDDAAKAETAAAAVFRSPIPWSTRSESLAPSRTASPKPPAPAPVPLPTMMMMPELSLDDAHAESVETTPALPSPVPWSLRPPENVKFVGVPPPPSRPPPPPPRPSPSPSRSPPVSASASPSPPRPRPASRSPSPSVFSADIPKPCLRGGAGNEAAVQNPGEVPKSNPISSSNEGVSSGSRAEIPVSNAKGEARQDVHLPSGKLRRSGSSGSQDSRSPSSSQIRRSDSNGSREGRFDEGSGAKAATPASKLTSDLRTSAAQGQNSVSSANNFSDDVLKTNSRDAASSASPVRERDREVPAPRRSVSRQNSRELADSICKERPRKSSLSRQNSNEASTKSTATRQSETSDAPLSKHRATLEKAATKLHNSKRVEDFAYTEEMPQPPLPPPPPPPPPQESHEPCSESSTSESELEENVDQKAEEFINRFKQQIKLQREQSYREHLAKDKRR